MLGHLKTLPCSESAEVGMEPQVRWLLVLIRASLSTQAAWDPAGSLSLFSTWSYLPGKGHEVTQGHVPHTCSELGQGCYSRV